MGQNDTNFNVRQEIFAAIGKTDDPNLKMTILLILGVLDEITNRLDAIRADEAWMKNTVLNGHTLTHDSDHEWINKKRKEEDDNAISARKIRDNLIERALWVVLTVIVAGFGFFK